MAKNKMGDLRDYLFETIDMLIDNEKNSMTVEKAKQIANLAHVIVNSAKVEVDAIKATNGIYKGSGFIQLEETKELPEYVKNQLKKTNS